MRLSPTTARRLAHAAIFVALAVVTALTATPATSATAGAAPSAAHGP